jgi:hypothetical protein
LTGRIIERRKMADMDRFTRRAIIHALAACGCSTALPTASRAQTRTRSLQNVKGCRLTSREEGLLKGRGLKLGATFQDIAETGGGRRTTGNAETDRALDRALKRLADTFNVFPGFGFFDDGPYKNAFAFDGVLPQLPRTKGTVLYGDFLFQSLLQTDPSGTAVMWVMAHDFAHVWLFSTGDMPRLGTEDAPRTSKRVELHADFLAGFYVGQRQRENPSISLYETGHVIWELGDTNFNDPAHHGTPPERLAAAEAGFKVSYLEARDARYAYAAGLNYVLSL